MKITATAYKLPFFIENGFFRKRCTNCNSYFWTQDSSRDTCGDAPCEPYTFLGSPPTKRSFSLDELREAFLAFFNKNGHTRIKPYPVVARWRKDLFVTIASITDFQPYVTDGIIPPPANPLVISQPCLRFNDIDSVGLTGGRHFTIFEMGGAHAFNYPTDQIYWKNDTVRFHHEFVVDVLGVKSEAVTYKEGIWSGGGNAGPDLEGCICGLEVSTLVFMQYKVVDNKFVDMPIKIVDTGYGIERYTWLSKGSPSGFHAIYGNLLFKIMRLAGLENVDERIISESTRYSSTIKNVENLSTRMSFRKKIANTLGEHPMELDKMLTPIENVYTVLDHTKALIFLLAEGVVPSNARVGYLTRLLIRRTYRGLRTLGIVNALSEIVDLQIKYWSPQFPNIQEMKQEILEAISVEEKKYGNTLKKGIKLTEKISLGIKSSGKNEIPMDTLVELYDSHGISPEIVEEVVTPYGINVNIPDNFYAMIAQRHVSPQLHSEEITLTDKFESTFSSIPPTQILYYDFPYVKNFDATVLKVINGKYVVLDKTYFYPESGGQNSDQGFLKLDNKQIKIINVFKIGHVVLHLVESEAPGEKASVVGVIDWDRRLSLMRHHTSTHIILGAARKVLGNHVWQAGAEKEVDRSRLDISHWTRITQDQTNKIEQLANEIVMANIEVDSSWVRRENAEEKYGYRIYQGGVVPGKQIRLIRIGEFDVEACGGTHVRATGEIGLIKVLRVERIQDGVERITFSSGTNALSYVKYIEDQMRKTSKILNVSLSRVVSEVEERCAKVKKLTKEIETLRADNSDEQVSKILSKGKKIENILLVSHVLREIDPDSMIRLSDTLVKKEPNAVIVLCSVNQTVRIVVMAGADAIKLGVNSGLIASRVAAAIGGGGGGRSDLGQGGGTDVKNLDDALKIVEEVVRNQIGGKSVVS